MCKLIPIFFLTALFIACAGKESTPSNSTIDGAMIYKKYCVLCHGVDGKLGLNGSKDLTISVLTKEERMEMIRNGKNAMTPFKGILSEEEIEAVAAYTMTLKSS